MNLLLLLSALLSALSGVGGARVPVPALVAERSVSVRRVAEHRQVATSRPIARLPSLPAVAGPATIAAPFALAVSQPAWATRRRE